MSIGLRKVPTYKIINRQTLVHIKKKKYLFDTKIAGYTVKWKNYDICTSIKTVSRTPTASA